MGAADASVFTRHIARIGEHAVPYLRGGRGAPLVYLHGLGGAGKWESYHMAFANDMLTYAPQLPGWQDFAPPAGIDDVAGYAALVAAFLDAIDVRQFTLVGHSLGGWIAQYVAADHSERVTRLVLVDSLGVEAPGVPAVDLGLLDEEAFAKAVFARLGLIATAQPYGFGAEFTNVRNGPEFERQWKGRELAVRLSNGRYSDPALTARLPSIAAETLLVWGEADGLAPLAHARHLQAAIPHARLAVVQGAGHLPMVEKRETFHRICHDFLVGTLTEIPGVLSPTLEH